MTKRTIMGMVASFAVAAFALPAQARDTAPSHHTTAAAVSHVRHMPTFTPSPMPPPGQLNGAGRVDNNSRVDTPFKYDSRPPRTTPQPPLGGNGPGSAPPPDRRPPPQHHQ